MNNTEAMDWFAWGVSIPAAIYAIIIYAQFVGAEIRQLKENMTGTDVQFEREVRLTKYEDALTAFANMSVLGMPVNVGLRSPDFQEGFALAVQVLANLAEDVLGERESVDMTDEERAEAQALIDAWAPDRVE